MQDYYKIKTWRIDVMKETMAIVRVGTYSMPDGKIIALPVDGMKNDVFNDIMFPESNRLAVDGKKFGEASARICVVDADCLDAALALKAQGYNPVVLNMASWTHPGGGYLSGAGAQEESLFRRTNYFQHLVNPDRLPRKNTLKYPIPEYGAIYSPDVIVFR
nr:TIGR02452 family protein [Candidatus Sigynarchaeota archaeon]